MKRVIAVLVILILAGILLPPAYYTLRGEAEGLDPAPLEIPVLVIHGDDDRSVPIEVGEDLFSRAKPAAKMVRVEGGSHMLPITHPDLLAQHLLEFAD